jgi:hypothetical protein
MDLDKTWYFKIYIKKLWGEFNVCLYMTDITTLRELNIELFVFSKSFK